MPSFKVPLFRPSITDEDAKAVAETMFSGHLTTGTQCAELERGFTEILGIRHAIAVSSGSAALHLALMAVGVGPGDAVFVPTLSFPSLAQAVEWQGATPVPVDSEYRTLCLDPVRLREAVKSVTSGIAGDGDRPCPKAVIVIDYGGQMADYSALREVCKENGLALIEDAAHTMISSWRAGPDQPWQSPGQVADPACFSFYANKCVTTGEGGMIATNNEQWAAAIRSLSLHGIESLAEGRPWAVWKREVVRLGYKYNLSDMAAALGLSQLSRVEQHTAARRRIAEGYAERLGGCPRLKLPEEIPNRRHAWHIYAVRLAGCLLEERRNAVMSQLYQRGVETSMHWYPLHKHKYYARRLMTGSDFPVAEEASASMFSLPIFPSMTEEQLDFVTEALLAVVAKSPRETAVDS